jgi:hypothetical protein
VVDQYFLATELPDDDEVMTMDLRMPSPEMKIQLLIMDAAFPSIALSSAR